MDSKTKTDRLIGGLGAAGGVLLLSMLINYLIDPSFPENRYYWTLTVPFIIIGASLVAVSIFLSLKNRNRLSKP